MPGRDRSLASLEARRGAGVRGVQLADHLIDDVEQFLTVAHVGDQRLVFGARGVPVLPMHLRVVEAVFHRAPGVVEHLGPFGRPVDFDFGHEVDAPASPLASAAAASRSGAKAGKSAAARAAARRRERNRIGRLAFTEEERAAVARDVQITHAAAEAGAGASTSSLSIIVGAALPSSNAIEPAAILL